MQENSIYVEKNSVSNWIRTQARKPEEMIKVNLRLEKNYTLGRTRAFDLSIISSRPIQYRVTELMVCRILQEKRYLWPVIGPY